MELNKTYPVNIVSQPKEGHCSFVVVERFSTDSSKHYLNYYKKLLSFNQCSEWFSKLDCSSIEVGKIVLSKTNVKHNLWARGVISKIVDNNALPELYFIDSQKFSEPDSYIELKSCPRKFAQLVLPTYYIDVDLNLNNLEQKVIEALIEQNQYGKISFSFTPLSIKNNVYCGELIVNYTIDNFFVSLKKLLRNIHKYKCFDDVLKYRQHRFSIFEPLKIYCLQTIFIPKDPNVIFSEEFHSFLDLNSPNNSIESNQFAFASTSSSISDDSKLEFLDLPTSINSIRKPHSNSFSDSSISTDNLFDLCCSKKTCIKPSFNSTIDESTSYINQNITEKQEFTFLETSEKSDENKLNNLNTAKTTHDVINEMSTSKYSKFDTKNINNTQLGVKLGNTIAQENKANYSKDLDMKKFMKNHIRHFKKLKNNNCLQNDNSTVSETTTISTPLKTKKKFIYQTYADTVLYWTDEES